MLKRLFACAAATVGLQRIPRTQYVTVNGLEVTIPAIPDMSFELTEPWMTELLSRVLRARGGTFCDIGVNVGQTLVKVKALDAQRNYVGFEPNPACVFFVQKLIQRNHFRGCTILPVGLFTENAVLALDLFLDSPTDESASLIKDFRPNKVPLRHLLVPVFQFDRVANFVGSSEIGIVKIDVEGAELEVVRSLVGAIRRHRPIMLFEVLPVYSEDNSFRLERQIQLEQELSKLDYQIFRVTKTTADEYAGVTRIQSIGIHGDLDQCDYVAALGSDVDKLDILLRRS